MKTTTPHPDDAIKSIDNAIRNIDDATGIDGYAIKNPELIGQVLLARALHRIASVLAEGRDE